MSHAKSSFAVPDELKNKYAKKPKNNPATIEEYRQMSFAERNWLYENDRDRYERLKLMSERGY